MIEVHVAERAEDAAARLAGILAAAPAEPMTPEWIAVPSVGMRRWLSLELARHLGASSPGAGDGIAGNIRYAFPGALRARVLAAGRGAGRPGVDDEDPWALERLVWTVLAVAEDHPDDPHLRGLDPGSAQRSRYGTARRVADLFDRYHVHRPEMIQAWIGGADLDGAGRPLDDRHRWQAHLWRLVRARLDRPSPPERLPQLLEQLTAGRLQVDLPPRVVLFGLTVLPGGPGFLRLARALAVHRQVHLVLLEPSGISAERVAARHPPERSAPLLRAEDRSAEHVDHPLLRSWGRLQRETTVLLEDACRDGLPVPQRLAATGLAGPGGHHRLLHALHADLRADRPPAGDRRFDPADGSLQFHACHGPTRQVEVLRDALLHLLADPDLDLSEDDIVVLCPALERFAPLVEAVFGPSATAGAPTGAGAAAPALRYRLADRSIVAPAPVVEATGALLELLAGRFDAPGVLDFMSRPPVRNRFGFGDDDLGRLTDWVSEGRVRWGLDAEHREPFGVPASVGTNTWRAALDRLLVGAAVHGDGYTLAAGDVAPLPVDDEDAALAGRLAELIWRLGTLVEDAATPRSVHDWVQLVRSATTELFAVGAEDAWQLRAVRRALAEVADAATVDGVALDTPITFGDLRVLLREQLRAAPSRPDFFRGGITVTSLTPLRGVPFRVVALLGMDQEALAPGRVDGDDLVAASPRLGDGDVRGDLRQSLLDAVLAARDHVLVVRSGHDERTNQPVPAAVAVAELFDTVVAMHHPADRAEAARRLEVHHPRQPYDEACFRPGALVAHTGAPWSFDPVALNDARQRLDRPTPDRVTPVAPQFLRPLPDPEPLEDVSLDELHRFLRAPVRYFLERRLGVRLPRAGAAPTARLPATLDPLERWEVGDRAVRALVSGRPIDEWAAVESRLGSLPPGVLTAACLDEVGGAAEAIVQAAAAVGLRPGRGTPVPVEVTLPDGTRVTGTVLDRLNGRVRGPARVGFQVARPAHRLAAWLDLMVLVAAHPGADWRSIAVHRGERTTDPPDPVVLEPRGARPDERHHRALAALGVAVDLLRRAQREPLPLFAHLSHAVATGDVKRQEWPGKDGGDDANLVVYGECSLEGLLALPARGGGADPPGPGGRVRRLAAYLWDAVARSVDDADPDGVR